MPRVTAVLATGAFSASRIVTEIVPGGIRGSSSLVSAGGWKIWDDAPPPP
jgi:hypothetical protein